MRAWKSTGLAALCLVLALALAYAVFPQIYLAVTSCPLAREIDTVTDQQRLYELAVRCPDGDKRHALVIRLHDAELLREIALDHSSWHAGAATFANWDDGLRAVAIRRLDDESTLLDIALREHEPAPVLRLVLSRLDHPAALEAIATTGPGAVRDLALARLTDEARVAQVLAHRRAGPRRPTTEESAAVGRLQRPEMLATVALQAPREALALLALQRIEDAARLRRVAVDGAAEEVRLAALARLTAAQDIADVVVARHARGDAGACSHVERIEDFAVLARLAVELSRGTPADASRPWDATASRCRRAGSLAVRRLAAAGEEGPLAAVAERAAGYPLRSSAVSGIRSEAVLRALESRLAAAASDGPGAQPTPGDEAVLRLVRGRLRGLEAIARVRSGEYDREDASDAMRALIARGEDSTLPLLEDILWRFGDKRILDVYLNAGSGELADMARSFARARGYKVMDVPVPAGSSRGGGWGSGASP